MLVCKCFCSAYVVTMFMGYKYRFNFFYIQRQPFHPFFGLPARYTGIDQHRLSIITYVVTITVAARIKRCNKKRHKLQK